MLESSLEAWIKIEYVEKLYKFKGKFIPLQGCMFNYREIEYKEGILFEFLIKLVSLMGLIELIMIELGWDQMLNDKKEKKRKAFRADQV